MAQAVSLRPFTTKARSVHVGFVDKAALGKVSSRALLFSTVNIIPPGLPILMSPEDEQ
jgi:hypothetical protein